MFNQSFDETLYRIVESDDVSSKAGELKERIDREPEFRVAFDQTRRTVASLQGLAPSAAVKEATFTQSDVDKLTRDILKGYKIKFAEVLSDLGMAYSLETKANGFGLGPRKPIPTREEGINRLSKGRSAYSAMSTTDEVPQMLGQVCDQGLQAYDPATRALQCFSTSRMLRPNQSRVLSREALAWLRCENYARSQALASAALDIARNPFDRALAVSTNIVLLLRLGKNFEAHELTNQYLATSSDDVCVRLNNAVIKVALRDTKAAVDEFGRVISIFSSTQNDLMVTAFKAMVSGIEKKDPIWIHFRRDEAQFSRFVKDVETYLGSELSTLVEGVV